MGCCSSPKPFKILIEGKERIVWGMDQIVFSTIISFPSDEQAAAQSLWEGARLLNPDIKTEEEEAFKKALLPVYYDAKKAYEIYEENAKE